MASAPSRHIFISFASEDLELAHRAVESLEKAGFRCWISDRDIDPAGSYPAAITSAVTECGVLLLLLTESSNSSPHVLREVELAFNAKRPVLPVRIAGVTPTSDLQYFLSTTQWLDAGARFDEEDLAKVVPALKDLLEHGRSRTGGVADDRRWWLRIAAVTALGIIAVTALVFWYGRDDSAGPVPDAPATDRTLPGPVPEPSPSPSPAPTPGPSVKVNARDGQSYVWVEPGEFVMGCSEGDPDCQDDEKPTRLMAIKKGFWLAQMEVTDAQFRKANPKHAGEGSDPDLPVVGVNWAAAKAYCAGIGGRLPTESEWEFAARGGTRTRYYGQLSAIAWYGDNSDERIHPVSMKQPNAFGLQDMLGNVAEWVLDRYYNKYYDDTGDTEEVEQPLAGNASGVARGGSWISEPAGVRVSRRQAMPPDAEEPFIGFRCAMDQL